MSIHQTGSINQLCMYILNVYFHKLNQAIRYIIITIMFIITSLWTTNHV